MEQIIKEKLAILQAKREWYLEMSRTKHVTKSFIEYCIRELQVIIPQIILLKEILATNI